MENQDLDLIGKTVSNLPYKIAITGKNNEIIRQYTGRASDNTIRIPEDDLGTSTNTGGNTGGDTGGEDNKPAVGIDYYPGSLADGEITQRTLKWKGTDDPSKSNKITFSDDPGTNFYGQFTGVTMLAHVQKQVMTKGVLGDISTLPINYDTANKAKSGYYTTVASYPIYAKSASFPAGQKVAIPFNGIGEGLSGKNTKAPIVYFTYNADKSMTIEHEAGYDNDGASDGATGANYQVVIELIATFSTQNAVAQLPASVNLFTGSTSGDIKLVGPSAFNVDVMDGYAVTFDQYAVGNFGLPWTWSQYPNVSGLYRIDVSKIGITTIYIPKEELIIGNTIDLNLPAYSGAIPYTYTTPGGSNWINPPANSAVNEFKSYSIKQIEIKDNNVLNVQVTVTGLQATADTHFDLTVSKVTTYKK